MRLEIPCDDLEARNEAALLVVWTLQVALKREIHVDSLRGGRPRLEIEGGRGDSH